MADDIAIKVDHVSKAFKLPHEKQSSIKGLFVNMFHGKRTYERQQVLNDISFEIKKGEFFGIVGRNGSGKSTLLKLLAGIYSPDNGHIQINGKLTPFIELGVGFNPELTGRENVFLNGALLGFNRKEMEAMYDEIVEFAELEKFMDQKLKNYSSGMQVRLAFSIAIRAETDILVLDEVLAVGDTAFQEKCKEYFKQIKKSPTTVVLVTHDMKSVTDYCERALLIDSGDIKLIKDPYTVSEAYQELNFSISTSAKLLTDDIINNEATLGEVKIFNKERPTAKHSFRPYDDISLEIEYIVNEDIKNAVVDLGLRSGKNGPYYFYTNTTDNGVITARKGQTIKLTSRIKHVFNGDTLYVATSMYDPKTLHVYARNRQATRFKSGAVEVGGLILADHKTNVKVT